MIRVMFVCWGNICRSPMAEFIFKKIVADNGIAHHFVIESSAISDEEIGRKIGNPVFPQAARELKKHKIDCKGKTAVQLKRDDYDKYDYFIGMEKFHLSYMERMLGGDPEGKISTLMSYTINPYRDIADPWYYGCFDMTYEDIKEGCEGLLEHILASEAWRNK